MKNLVALLFLFLPFNLLQAKIWQVGPTRAYVVPSAVSNLVAHGDTVEIDAGLYSGDVAKWYANNLLLKSVGTGYAHLEAAGNYAEGKGIWVIKGANCTVEGIEFSGCQVPDHNGAGIRQEGQNLTLRRCFFHHNEMGILTSNDGISEFWFESCEFASNGYGDGYSHNIYVGAVLRLTMLYCYSHDAHIGHLVKSRARYNRLFYNRFSGENGDGSFEVDMPNGGQAILLGNLIEQGPNSQNGGIISFALENQNHPEQQLILAHNTIVNDRFNGRFLQFSNATTLVKMVNNLLLGPGTLLQGNTAVLDTTHNQWFTNIADAMLVSPATFDYRPLAHSPCVDAGTDAGYLDTFALQAVYAYLHPLTRTARWFCGAREDVGAYEHLSGRYRAESLPHEIYFLEKGMLEVFPSLLPAGQRLTLRVAQPFSVTDKVRVFDATGVLVVALDLPEGENVMVVNLPALQVGVYLLHVSGYGTRRFVVGR